MSTAMIMFFMFCLMIIGYLFGSLIKMGLQDYKKNKEQDFEDKVRYMIEKSEHGLKLRYDDKLFIIETKLNQLEEDVKIKTGVGNNE